MSRKDDKTGDLFGEKSGLDLGHEAAERAADHAGVPWKEEAYAAFCAFARTHHLFTVEEVRQANPQIIEPPDRRAWGAVALRAQRDRVVEHAGWVSAKERQVHGNAVSLWRTLKPEER